MLSIIPAISTTALFSCENSKLLATIDLACVPCFSNQCFTGRRRGEKAKEKERERERSLADAYFFLRLEESKRGVGVR